MPQNVGPTVANGHINPPIDLKPVSASTNGVNGNNMMAPPTQADNTLNLQISSAPTARDNKASSVKNNAIQKHPENKNPFHQ